MKAEKLKRTLEENIEVGRYLVVHLPTVFYLLEVAPRAFERRLR